MTFVLEHDSLDLASGGAFDSESEIRAYPRNVPAQDTPEHRAVDAVFARPLVRRHPKRTDVRGKFLSTTCDTSHSPPPAFVSEPNVTFENEQVKRNVQKATLQVDNRRRSLGNMAPKDSPLGKRVRALRKHNEWTQEQLADHSDGLLNRVDVARVERGWNEASSSRIREGLAKAFKMTQETVSAYIDGKITLADALAKPRLQAAHSTVAQAVTSTVSDDALRGVMGQLSQYGIVGVAYPSLAICIVYHRNRWTPATLAVAASGFFGPADVDAQEWASRLDRVEATLKQMTGGAEEIPPPPPSDHARAKKLRS